MALFVLVVVALVVAQTWLDWRDARKSWVLPDWAKGLALAGMMAASLAAASSFASAWLQDMAGQRALPILSRAFWPEVGFLFCAMGIVVATLRKKRLLLMLLLMGVLAECFLIVATLAP
jgi:hypothetical protein